MARIQQPRETRAPVAAPREILTSASLTRQPRRAVALPLNEEDHNGAAVSRLLEQAQTLSAGAVIPDATEGAQPSITAVPAAAERARAEASTRMFRPDSGRLDQPDAASVTASGASRSRSGHWPLMTAAAVAGAMLVSVPLVTGGDKKTSEAEEPGKVSVAGRESFNSTPSPAPDGNIGAGLSFPAPTMAPSGRAPSGLPHRVAEHPSPGETHASAANAGQSAHHRATPTAQPSKSDTPLPGRHRDPNNKAVTSAPVGKSALVSVPAQTTAPDASEPHSTTSAGPAKVSVHHASDVNKVADKSTAASAAPTASAKSQTASPKTQVTPASRAVAPTSTGAIASASTARTVAASAHSASDSTTGREWSTKVLNATYVLHSGESVASNRMRITMRADGDLAISDENGAIRWTSHTQGSGNYAVFQDDGNLAVYSANHSSLWTSATAGNRGAELVIQGDGNVVILSRSGDLLWAAGTAH
jgi:hypothetical protein